MRCNFLPQTMLRMMLVAGALCVGANASAQWTNVGTAGFMPGGNQYQHIFFDSVGTVYASFSNNYGQVVRYDDTGWASVGGANITTGKATESWSAMAPNGDIYFSYANGDSVSRAAVVKYDGTSWSMVGGNISTDTVSATNIVIASDGTPYISYIDHSTPKSLIVKKYDGTSWTSVGLAVTTEGLAYPSLAIDTGDHLYIAYEDDTASDNITVKEYDGTSWNMVGTSFGATTPPNASFVTLVIDHSGAPVVGYMSSLSGSLSASVNRYDKSTSKWVSIGSARFSPACIFVSLAVDHNDHPYVSYMDFTNSSKVSVMKYDGSSWANLGSAGFSHGPVAYSNIAIDPNDNPYIAGEDNTNGGTLVMKYPVCTPPDSIAVSASDTLICKGDTVGLSVSGNLNDASKWYWYSGSDKGTLVDSGATITLTPGDTTTYYVHGGGGCVLVSNNAAHTVDVDAVDKPTFTNSGGTLTSSASTGNQWYVGGAPISGATSNTYTITKSGWYKVMVTNSHNCSSMSDSTYLIAAGVAQVGNTEGMQVFPSPFINTLHVTFNHTQQDLSNAVIFITDNMGRKVFEHKGLEQNNSFSLQYLPNGVYFVNLITSKAESVLRVVKQ